MGTARAVASYFRHWLEFLLFVELPLTLGELAPA